MATVTPVLPPDGAVDASEAALQALRERDTEILRVAQMRFRQAETWEHDWRLRAMDDARFAAGDQWGDAGAVRRQEKRVALTINQMPKFLRQITNDQRQNRPAIRIRPVDSQSDPDTAQVLQDLIRHIEYDSDADVAYDWAFDGAVRKGRGYWRILLDYSDPYTFEQSIRIQRIFNDLVVYVDPMARMTPDYAGMDWAFLVERMSRERFCQMYEVTPSQYGVWQSLGDGWLDKDEVRIAEYFYRERQPVLLLQLPQGLRYVVVEPPTHAGMVLPSASPELLTLVALQMQRRQIAPLTEEEWTFVTPETPQRQTHIPVVWWLKITGAAVLERTVWPGQDIPIVPVLGEEVVLEQLVDYRGIVRDAIDAQRMYNFWATAEAETITLAPKAPYIGAEGQFEGHEAAWSQANTRTFSYLQYRPVTIGGVVLPPPQRNAIEPPIQAITIARQQAEHDLHNTTGIYPPALGQRSNETSGRAIRARQEQSQMGNFHFFGNLLRSLRRTGRILIDLIPHVYQAPRVVRILGEDGSQRMVQLQAGGGQTREQGALPPGIDGIYDVTVGRYDVVVEAGPSYASKRAEAAESMTQMTQAYPRLMEIGGDILVSHQDWPGAEQLAQRLKKTIPPQLLDTEQQDPEQQALALQAQLQQMSQQLQALNAYAQDCEGKLQEATQVLETLKGQQASKQAELALKQQELQLDHQVKMAELDLKRQELQLKQHELLLEAQRIRQETAPRLSEGDET